MGGAEHGGRLAQACVSCACDAEVHDLDVAIGLDHDVLRFDIAMDDAAFMTDLQRLRYLRADLSSFSLVDRAAFFDRGFQIGSLEELHDDVVGIAFGIQTPVIDAHDIRALQFCRRCSFLAKARLKGLISCVLRQHDLHGHHAVQHGIVSAIHFCHTTDANAFDELIAVVQCHARHASSHV